MPAEQEIKDAWGPDSPYPEPGCDKRTGNASNLCLLWAGHEGDCDDEPSTMLLRKIARLRAELDERRMAVHAALNTYETTDRAPGVYDDGGTHSVVGANRRRLIIKEQLGGVWIGGCKVESGDDMRRLAALLLAMATELSPAAFPSCYCGTGREHKRGLGYHCAPVNRGDTQT